MLTQDEQKALKHLAKGEYEEAIKIYKDLLKEEEDPDLYNTLGDVYLRKGEREEAIKCYEKALKLYEKDSLFENAIAVGKKILRYGERKDILLALARLNTEIERKDEAIEYIARLLKLGIEEEDVETISEILKRIGESISRDSDIKPRFERLFYKFQEVVEKLGKMNLEENLEDIQDTGNGLEELLKFEETLSFEDEGVEEPEEKVASEIEAPLPEEELLKGLELQEEKEVALEKEIEEKEEKVEIPEGILIEGLREEARPIDFSFLKELASSIKKPPILDINPILWGKELFTMGLYNEALHFLQKALLNPGDRREALLLISKALFEMGELEPSKKAAKRLLDEGIPSSSIVKEAFYILGRICEKEGLIKEAIDCYSEVLSLDFDFQDARERLEKLKRSQNE